MYHLIHHVALKYQPPVCPLKKSFTWLFFLWRSSTLCTWTSWVPVPVSGTVYSKSLSSNCSVHATVFECVVRQSPFETASDSFPDIACTCRQLTSRCRNVRTAAKFETWREAPHVSMVVKQVWYVNMNVETGVRLFFGFFVDFRKVKGDCSEPLMCLFVKFLSYGPLLINLQLELPR